MAFDFPNSPTVGQTFSPAGGPTYVWTGVGWAVSGTTGNVLSLQVLVSGSGTYTTPVGTLWLEVEMVGGGGGGGNTNTGNAGTSTTFGSLTAGGGGGAPTGGTGGGAGGTASGGQINLVGTPGVSGSASLASTYAAFGGAGGSSFFGGGGGAVSGGAGGNGGANTGSGGGGGGTNNVNTIWAGAGGGSGGYVRTIIMSPAATYSYSVGTGGTGAAATGNWFAAGNGAAGVIIVTAYGAAGVTAAAPALGTVVNTAYAELATYTSTTTQMAGAITTAPQQTDGAQLLTVTITPKSTTDKLRVHFSAVVSVGTGSAFAWFALFQDTTAGAITATSIQSANVGYPVVAMLDIDMVAGTTSPTTLKIRYGNNAGSGAVIAINGSGGAQQLGNTQRAVLQIWEIAA